MCALNRDICDYFLSLLSHFFPHCMSIHFFSRLLSLIFVATLFHPIAISFRTFLSVRIVDERLKLLTIMDFVRHSFFNPKALSRSFVSSFVRLFPSFFIGSMELGECQGVERDRPIYEVFFGPRGDCATV